MDNNYLVEFEDKYEEFESYRMAREFYDIYKDKKEVRLILGIVKADTIIELKELI